MVTRYKKVFIRKRNEYSDSVVFFKGLMHVFQQIPKAADGPFARQS